MEPVWGGTLWALSSCWLLCQYLRAPALITRVAAGLLVAELVLLGVHSYDCDDGGCGPVGRVAGSGATVDLPALSAVVIALATLRAWRRARRSLA